MTAILNIRPRRQVTFPELALRKVDARVGDSLVMEIRDNKIILTPRKRAFLDAFKAIQRAIKESGVSEKGIQEAARKDREEYVRKNYPYLYGQ